ncbi:RTA1 like protein-domain-containing protein [Calycina marina]|uniref:RTA1 like protein-domain-containing protein n=1 Tax=Calycina marina TaxID=1763456 RepID=A0A9P7Z418_9HELO|nr:RTA1 like protein-domain-containing protein [Calycina marina]
MSGPEVAGLPGIAANITYLSDCTPKLCDMKYATMEYVPNVYANELYLALFAIFLVVQLIMVFPYHTWSYTFMMFLGSILECVGYWGRLAMHFNIFMETPFLINIIALTIAPVFYTAAIYLTLARIIRHYGVYNSLISPRTYTVIFLTADVVSLILQSLGGGMANAASTKEESLRGVHVMLGGLAFQVFSMTIFMLICAIFFLNVRKDQIRQKATNWATGKIDPPAQHIKGYSSFVIIFAFAFFLILVRSCFRVAELSHGFDGKLANQEIPFMILEGGMLLLATFIMTAWHPGRFMKREWKKSKPVVEPERKFSIGSGSTNNGSGYYPNGRPNSSAMQPTPSQWPSHGNMQQVPL